MQDTLVLLNAMKLYGGVEVQGGADKSLARPKSGFIQRTPHEAQYTS